MTLIEMNSGYCTSQIRNDVDPNLALCQNIKRIERSITKLMQRNAFRLN